MSQPAPRFLRTPAEIRKALGRLNGGKRLDLAVAFVGADWRELLAGHRGKLRLICWLSSTNTDPSAVEDLMKRRETEVRQRNSMHSKVYVAPGTGAIVGSANLSRAALSDSEISGQDEAAVFVSDTVFVSEVAKWFNSLWNDKHRTKDIKKKHLDAAKEAWNKARKFSPHLDHRHSLNGTINVPALPSKIHQEILKYANKVRSSNLEDEIGEPCKFTQSLNPATLTKGARNGLLDHIVSWAKHPGAYKTFRSHPLPIVRKGLQILFDETIDTQMRINQIVEGGYLSGLGIPSLSLLLYWRDPERFVPYNFRTIKFLRHYKLLKMGMSASSSICYVKWLRWATRLAQELHVSPGHVDRMVELYYEDHEADS